MWSTLIRLFTILFFKRQLSSLKNNFLDLRHEVADYTEDRAQQFREDFVEETERLASSLVGLLVVFSMLIFTGLLGIMWLFSMLWSNPDRNLILGVAMLIPMMIGMSTFIAVRRIWRYKPLFANSLSIISHDWKLFRDQMAPNSSEDPNSTQQTNTTNIEKGNGQ